MGMTENDAGELERLMEKLRGSIQPIMQESRMKESSTDDFLVADTDAFLVAEQVEKLKEAFEKVAEAAQNAPAMLIVFAKSVEAAEPSDALDSDPVRDIAWLKKAIKHSRNPMERKRLEMELNTAYKRRKRKTG